MLHGAQAQVPIRGEAGRTRRRALARAVVLALLGLAAFVAGLIYGVAAAEDAPAGTRCPGPVSRGSLLLPGAEPGRCRAAPLLSTDVVIRVAGPVLRARLRQRFANPGADWVEAVYVFPLPEQAAVDRLRMRIGERLIEGLIREREQARRSYEQARDWGRRATLIEQERPNLFTASIANLGPGETVSVEIEYQQVLDYVDGAFGLRFPTAVTPRYTPADRPVPDAARITAPAHPPGRSPDPLSLRVELDAGFPIAHLDSPYHAVERSDHGEGRVTVVLAEGEPAADRDFALSWAPVPGSAPRAALFTEPAGGAFHHLLVLVPPEATAGAPPLPREVIYVVDTSGSMAGPSIAQARETLRTALAGLRPWDRFNVIAFASTPDPLFPDARPATAPNLRAAARFVARLRADGGTEIRPALEAALDGREDGPALRQVVFLTDGAVGNERELLDLVARRLGDSRLFTVAIGPAPNRYLMRKAAELGRGSLTSIGDLREVQARMAALLQRLEGPVMLDLQVELTGDGQAEIWPRALPDLYLGEPLVVTARTPADSGEIRITGLRGDAPWRAHLPLSQARAGRGIAGVWARAKIGALTDTLHEGADPDAVRAQVVRVALAHHLVSPYTSLVAVDLTPARPGGAPVERRAVPGALPRGLVNAKVLGPLPRTATSAPASLAAGVLLVLAAGLLWPRARRRRR